MFYHEFHSVGERREGLRKTVREIRKIRDERNADKEKKEKEKNGNLISGLKKEVEDVPGVKETKEMTETVRSGQKYHKNSKIVIDTRLNVLSTL